MPLIPGYGVSEPENPLGQGPHLLALDGPNTPSVGVPIAADMCIGAESTPIKMRLIEESAAICFRVNCPPRSIGLDWHEARIASIIARSAVSGAQVSTTRKPRDCNQSMTGATCDSGHRLNIQREVGWQ